MSTNNFGKKMHSDVITKGYERLESLRFSVGTSMGGFG